VRKINWRALGHICLGDETARKAPVLAALATVRECAWQLCEDSAQIKVRISLWTYLFIVFRNSQRWFCRYSRLWVQQRPQRPTSHSSSPAVAVVPVSAAKTPEAAVKSPRLAKPVLALAAAPLVRLAPVVEAALAVAAILTAVEALAG
jgi:hypothetical protein